MLKNLLRRLSKHKPNIGHVYAVKLGHYAGEFFVVEDIKKADIKLISLPRFRKRSMPAEAIDHAIKNGIIVFLEQLPHDIFKYIITMANKP